MVQTVQALLLDYDHRAGEALGKLQTVGDLASRVAALQGEIAKLEVEKSKREEVYARKEREIEHKLGLERQRQEQDLAVAKREAILSVQEKNLQTEREAFAKQMAFTESRFTTQMQDQKELLQAVMERLPTIKITDNTHRER